MEILLGITAMILAAVFLVGMRPKKGPERKDTEPYSEEPDQPVEPVEREVRR